jgi:hypothetical protein
MGESFKKGDRVRTTRQVHGTGLDDCPIGSVGEVTDNLMHGDVMVHQVQFDDDWWWVRPDEMTLVSPSSLSALRPIKRRLQL